MKNKVLVRVICIILAAAMIIGSGFYLVYLIADNGSVAYGADADENAYEQLERLELVIKNIKANYKEDIDIQKLVDAAYDGVFDSLDPWSEYYASVEEEEAFTNSLQEESYCGVGITIQEQPNGKIKATQLNPNGSGFEAGIRKGDIFTHVNGQSVEGWDVNKLADTLRGPENTKVRVTVLRGGQSLDFTLTRKKLTTVAVSYEILDNRIGYIELSSFNDGVSDDFLKAVEKIDEAGINKIILDLRDNPGGYTDEAYKCLSYILSPGKDLIKYVRNGEVVDGMLLVGDPDQSQEAYEIVTLINENTASAAEIMAIALKGNNAATLVGVNSFGKGVAQQIFNLGNGDSMKLSVCYFVGPNDEKIDGVGIKPDHIVYNGADLSDEDLAEIVNSVIPMNEGKKYTVRNSYGINVLAAQQRLAALGYLVKPNGILDETTMECLKDVQKTAGLCPYGALDFSTIKALEAQFQAFLYGESDAQLSKAIELLK